MDPADNLLDAMATLTVEIRGLRRDLRRTADGDGSPDAMLLAEIDAAFGDEFEFTSAQLAEHAMLPSRPRLRQAIIGCIGPDIGVRKLGKRLASIQDFDLGGLRVARWGTKRHCATWRVIAA